MTLTATYGNFGGLLVHEERSGAKSDYVGDTLGSVVAILDNTGTATSQSSFWPYGEPQSVLGANITPWAYCGQRGYYEDTTSLYYIRSRHYTPEQSQWLTADPVRLDWLAPVGFLFRPYEYCLSRPTVLVDWTGAGPSLVWPGVEWIGPVPKAIGGIGGAVTLLACLAKIIIAIFAHDPAETEKVCNFCCNAFPVPVGSFIGGIGGGVIPVIGEVGGAIIGGLAGLFYGEAICDGLCHCFVHPSDCKPPPVRCRVDYPFQPPAGTRFWPKGRTSIIEV